MSAVDGLISGMATSDVIRQLMQLERQPVIRLQAKKTAADKAVTALQSLNTKFSALMDLAKKFKTSGWTAGGVTSTHPNNLAAQAAPGTAATTLNVTVKSLATAHKIQSSGVYAATSDKVADKDDPITFNYLDTNGAATSVTITRPHDGSLQGIADAVNASSTAPATAAVVFDTAANGYRLEFTAKRTGAFSGFNVSGIQKGVAPAVTFNTVVAASDAEITLGSGDFAQTMKSTSNVMEIADGITVALKIADPATAITISVVESSKPADDVEKLVNAANEILKEIKTLTGYDAASKKAGVLQGNSTLRGLQADVMRAVTDAVGGASAGELGLQLNREGTLNFDKAKFDAAYAADPAKVAAIMEGTTTTPGVAMRLAAVAETATKFGTGRLTSAIEARRNEIKRIDDTIATWDVRLVKKEARLRKQFAALETALGAFQQQGNWLAGQIASLPKID